MDGHDRLDRIMQQRQIPPMRSNLPDRIIAASLREPIVEAKAPKIKAAAAWIVDFWDSFALPKPVFAMAMVVALVVGVYIGMTPQVSVAVAGVETAEYTQAIVLADLGDML